MRTILTCFVVGTLLLAALPSRAERVYNVNFLFGAKALDEDDWTPVDSHTAIGVTTTFGSDDWPVHIALDLVASRDDATFGLFEVDGSTVELAFGARKIWGRRTRPFIGGGLAAVNGEFELGSISDDDTSLGFWLDAGIFWRIGPRFNLGLEGRISRAEVTLFGVDGEGGGEFIGLVLGFGSSIR